jgi:hypothetical protein
MKVREEYLNGRNATNNGNLGRDSEMKSYNNGKPYTSRGVRTVWRGDCANLPP